MSFQIAGVVARAGEAPVRQSQKSDDWLPVTASVASRLAIQTLCQRRDAEKRHVYRMLFTVPEIFAERIRIQNLRFAYFLCDAQKVSGVIKR
jgi:hypothetical protein